MPRAVKTEECKNCRECVEVCPMQCFHDALKFIVINIDECIDCALCENSCPHETIINHENHSIAYAEIAASNTKLAQQYPKVY